jgi:5'-nucleotidase
MNPGGIRADIEQGEVTWGELFAVQPFGNNLVKMTLTGEQIRRLLNQQWQQANNHFLQISGLRYTWDDTRPVGDKVVDIFLPDGSRIDPDAAYTVTANSFLAEGGDNFTVFTEGTDREVGPVDLDALVEYVKQLPQPFSASIEGRIEKIQ